MHLSGSTRKLNVTKEDTGKSGDNVQMLPSDEKSDKIFADSYADFAIKAFQNSYEAGKNTMISPYSVINALAMTANGASIGSYSVCKVPCQRKKIIIYIQRILSGTKILMRTLYRQMIF